MSEIVVVGSFTAKPGREDEAIAAFEALLEPTHGEEGCILYALHRGVDDPARLAFIERWSSREALDAHLASPHVSAVLGRVDELFGEGGEVVVYEARAGGDQRKGSIAGHAGG
jgi:quinol monooxygenase YgiN